MKRWGKWPADGDFGHCNAISGGNNRKKSSKNPEKMLKAYFGIYYLIKNTYLMIIVRKSSKLYIKKTFALSLHQVRVPY